MEKNVKAIAAYSATTPLRPYSLKRRSPLDHDVGIEIAYCGVCHSDIHTVRGEWGATSYPCVPGHEIVGRVIEIGKKVKKFKLRDLACRGRLLRGLLWKMSKL